MKRLLATSNDGVLTLLRLVLGIVFFLHGAQKVLGWFGGFGFSGTMHAFTGMMHIPAPFAFLAIMAEFLGGIGLIVGLLARDCGFRDCGEHVRRGGARAFSERAIYELVWESEGRGV